MADSTDENTLLIGECNRSNSEIASTLIKKLESKIPFIPFTRGKKIIPVLFLKNKPKDLNDVRHIKILYPEDVIKLNRLEVDNQLI